MDDKSELSLEKLRINDRLRDLELSNARIVSHLDSERGTWTRYTESIHKSLERLEVIVRRHDDTLIGNGKEPGVMTRIDRFEIAEKNRGWNIKLIWTTIAGLVSQLVYAYLKRG